MRSWREFTGRREDGKVWRVSSARHSPKLKTLPVFPSSCLISLLLLAGCANAGKAEAGSLAQAIERYRVAENSLKGSMAEALDHTPCSVVDVCETKRACLAVSGPTARALALKHQVEVGLAEVRAGKMDHDSPEARTLPDKLDEAARLLEEGHAALPTCDEKLQALKRKYGI